MILFYLLITSRPCGAKVSVGSYKQGATLPYTITPLRGFGLMGGATNRALPCLMLSRPCGAKKSGCCSMLQQRHRDVLKAVGLTYYKAGRSPADSPQHLF
jgi:hypothetical protein